MHKRSRLVYGTETPPVSPILLRAGRLTAMLDADTGHFRYVRIGAVEVLRGIYAAVRTVNWGAIFASVNDLELAQEDGFFSVRFTANHAADNIDFSWQGSIEASETSVTYTMVGTAGRDFLTQRVGLCVLHPASVCAGKPCTVEHSDETVREYGFLLDVDPREPFTDIRTIWQSVDGVDVRISFDGDNFGIEDQRNWGDASFKTYCALGKPHPYAVLPGEVLRHRIACNFDLVDVVGKIFDFGAPASLSSSVDDPARSVLELGVRVSGEFDAVEAASLKRLRPQILRVVPDRLAAVRELVAEMDPEFRPMIQLELDHASDEGLKAASCFLQQTPPPQIDRVWVSPPEANGDLAAAYDLLPAGIARGRSSLTHFTEANRSRPERTDGALSFAFTPQTHAFDVRTIVEVPESLDAIVRTARSFSGLVQVGPIRFSGGRRDSRLGSLVASAFTLECLRVLAATEAQQAIFYDVAGNDAIVSNDKVSPVYFVLADYLEFSGGSVRPLHASRPYSVSGIELIKDDRRRLMIANLTPDDQTIDVDLHDRPEQLRMSVLDGDSVEAMTTNSASWPHRGSPLIEFGIFTLHLKPYSYIRIDEG